MMREVTREEFRDVYFRLGGGEAVGWGEASWKYDREGMRYKVELPESPRHTRMMIVTDFGAREYRLFFLTEESEESFFTHPGKE